MQNKRPLPEPPIGLQPGADALQVGPGTAGAAAASPGAAQLPAEPGAALAGAKVPQGAPPRAIVKAPPAAAFVKPPPPMHPGSSNDLAVVPSKPMQQLPNCAAVHGQGFPLFRRCGIPTAPARDEQCPGGAGAGCTPGSRPAGCTPGGCTLGCPEACQGEARHSSCRSPFGRGGGFHPWPAGHGRVQGSQPLGAGALVRHGQGQGKGLVSGPFRGISEYPRGQMISKGGPGKGKGKGRHTWVVPRDPEPCARCGDTFVCRSKARPGATEGYVPHQPAVRPLQGAPGVGCVGRCRCWCSWCPARAGRRCCWCSCSPAGHGCWRCWHSWCLHRDR